MRRGPSAAASSLFQMSAVVFACVLLAPSAWAQQASGIAGVVKDTSGAVLPGVTVEAASPALIEKVRTAISDGEGRYNIVDLRPGAYTVTFTLPGFSTFLREGIQLTAGFTATVNAELRVGALEETITVSGAAPLVDTQNVRQQKVVSKELLDVLPTSGKGLTSLVTLSAGVTTLADVGGTAGAYSSSHLSGATVHGKTGMKTQYDNMRINNMEGSGSQGYVPNGQASEEVTMETGGGLAESNAAAGAVNVIPKEGGNTFKGTVSGLYTNQNLQSDNLDDAMRARGLRTVDSVRNIYDAGVTVGGPIKKDRLWFFTAQRWWGNRDQIAGVFRNRTQGTPFFTPDFDRPGQRFNRIHTHAVRLTWQVSPKSKVNVFADPQSLLRESQQASATQAIEASNTDQFFPQGLYQFNWNLPGTNRLLLEAGAAFVNSHWPKYPNPGVDVTGISILEQSTNLRYNAAAFPAWTEKQSSDRFSQRFAMSYVTGSHAFKAGFQLDEGIHNVLLRAGTNEVGYRFLRGAPVSVDQNAVPYGGKEILKADLGLYTQDQWTTKRLTLNYGLRFEYFNGYVPVQHFPAGTFVPARDFAPVDCVPCWKDLSPRLGASYNLFGTGRTALKAALGRYTALTGFNITTANDPMITSVNSVNRLWNDANGNYVPNCDLRNFAANGECGPINNQNFGKNNPLATRYADDVLHGWRARDSLWDFSAEVQHELAHGISLTGGYYRNWSGNFTVTDNLDVGPGDYNPYCITAPLDPLLPSGGGYQVCGLYDVTPAKFGQVHNLVTQASNYGKHSRVSDFFGVNLNTRFGSGIVLGGGVDVGRTVEDQCFVFDSPQQLLYCRVVPPWSAGTQVKAFGSYPLPGNFVVAGTLQSVPGPVILANYAATTAEIAPSLGRNLAGGTRTATIPLIAPQTQFEGRRNQLDLRLTKSVKLGSKTRLQANFDVYNVLNANPILGLNTTYGASWRLPTGASSQGGSILPGRLAQFSGQLSF